MTRSGAVGSSAKERSGSTSGGDQLNTLDDRTIELLKSSLPLLPELNKTMEFIKNQMTGVTEKMKSMEGRLEKLEACQKDFGENMEKRGQAIEEINQRLEKWQERVEKRIEKIEESLNALEKEMVDRERHSRSWSIVMLNKIEENKGEDSEDFVRTIFDNIPPVKKRNIQFDIVHRVGKRIQGKHRPFLIRMIRKADTRYLLNREIKDHFWKSGFPIFADVPYADRVAKRLYQKEINLLCEKGHKAKFENGVWRIDNHLFKLDNYKGELGLV